MADELVLFFRDEADLLVFPVDADGVWIVRVGWLGDEGESIADLDGAADLGGEVVLRAGDGERREDIVVCGRILRRLGGEGEVGHDEWEVGSGKWEVGSGKWEVGSGKWEVGSEQ